MSTNAATAGQLGVRKFRVDHTGTPVVLTLGTCADGQYLRRNGTSLEGATVSGGSGQTIYDSIIPDDHSTLAAAVAAGANSVFVRNGTYSETATVTFPSVFHAVGESHNAIINLSTNSTVLQTPSATPYSTGTLQFTANSSTVTGTGTTWSTNVSAGDILVVGLSFHTVTAVGSNTSLTIQTEYQGPTVAGLSYYTFTPSTLHLENLTFSRASGTTGGILDIQYCFGPKVQYCQFVRPGAAANTGVAISLDTVAFGTVTECAFNFDDRGIDVSDVASFTIEKCSFQGMSDVAIGLQYCDGVVLNALTITGVNTGISLDSGLTSHLSLSNIAIVRPTGNGIQIIEDSFNDSLKMSNIYIEDSGAEGLEIAGDLVYSQFNGLTIAGSTNNGINFTGTNTIDDLMISDCHISNSGGSGALLLSAVITSVIFSACYFNGNGAAGMRIRGTDCTMTGCQANENTSYGVRVDGSATNCTITGCRMRGNNEGLVIQLGATDTIVTGCNTLGNTTNNYVDSGTSTSLANTKQ